jgi:intracellular septation protein A
MRLGVVLGFAPWIIFTVLCAPTTWEWATLTALIAAVVLAVPDWRRSREVSLLDVVSVVFFAVLSVLALVVDRADLLWVENRAQLLSSGVLTVVVVLGIAIGRPFSEHYARQSVPRRYWASPTFHRINVVISAVWAVAFAVNALCDAVVMLAPGTSTLLNWVVPALAIVAAVRFTMWYPDHASGEQEGEQAPVPGAPADGSPGPVTP